MCDRSFSDASRGLGMGVPPHIRDALEQARLAAEAAEVQRIPSVQPLRFPGSESQQDEDRFRLSLDCQSAVEGNFGRTLSKSSLSMRRESSLVGRLAEKEQQVRDLRTYVHDTLNPHKKQHAYLRATHLDPAIGLEIEILASGQPVTSHVSFNSDIEEIKAALTACELARDQLRGENRNLQIKLKEAEEWTEQLEQERNAYHTVNK